MVANVATLGNKFAFRSLKHQQYGFRPPKGETTRFNTNTEERDYFFLLSKHSNQRGSINERLLLAASLLSKRLCCIFG
jgi:hypothetical protein